MGPRPTLQMRSHSQQNRGYLRPLPSDPTAGSWPARGTCESGAPCEVHHSRGVPWAMLLGDRPWEAWASAVSRLAGPRPGPYLEILDVLGAAELRQARRPHQGEEVEEEQPVAPQDGVGPLAVAPEPARRRALGPAGHAHPAGPPPPTPAAGCLPSPRKRPCACPN